ncbi:hypothetical protein AVEN_224281-1 [Araneus ventricosus]|uniref:Uncharacterized protein n=1 Tax=Araneus ventricosus TaxID=182803 RepID=A0A4Y2A322_ARAVE|nr:hypothetical protein AVEN_224281-1 [Araneus ventricosus]
MKNPPAFWVWMQACTISHAKGIEIEIAETRGHQKAGVSILSSIWCFDVSDGGNKARYSLQCRGQMDSLMTWSRSLESPSAEDDVRIKRVFCYIAGTTNFAITYQATGTSRVLECYSDADFGGCTKTGRSASGSLIVYAGVYLLA